MSVTETSGMNSKRSKLSVDKLHRIWCTRLQACCASHTIPHDTIIHKFARYSLHWI